MFNRQLSTKVTFSYFTVIIRCPCFLQWSLPSISCHSFNNNFFFFCKSPRNWLQLFTEIQIHFSLPDDSGPNLQKDMRGQTHLTKIGFFNRIALRVGCSQLGPAKNFHHKNKIRKANIFIFNKENVTIRKMGARVWRVPPTPVGKFPGLLSYQHVAWWPRHYDKWT